MPTFDNIIIRWDGSVVLPESEVNMNLKGIEKFIQKVCVQDAVYWGSPVADGMGTIEYASPIAIKVRWDDLVKLKANNASLKEDIEDKATILTVTELEVGGMVKLGTLADILPYDQSKPFSIPDTYEIKDFEKTPMIKSSTIFVRKYFL
jgi:hypothetical protein